MYDRSVCSESDCNVSVTRNSVPLSIMSVKLCSESISFNEQDSDRKGH